MKILQKTSLIDGTTAVASTENRRFIPPLSVSNKTVEREKIYEYMNLKGTRFES